MSTRADAKNRVVSSLAPEGEQTRNINTSCGSPLHLLQFPDRSGAMSLLRTIWRRFSAAAGPANRLSERMPKYSGPAPKPYTGPPREEVLRLRKVWCVRCVVLERRLTPSRCVLAHFVLTTISSYLSQTFINPATFLYYKEPIMLVEGHGQWLFDEKGRRYLDAFAGIVTVSCGHSHPKVVAAMREQLETLMHTTTIVRVSAHLFQ
jgi:hypothetical protein